MVEAYLQSGPPIPSAAIISQKLNGRGLPAVWASHSFSCNLLTGAQWSRPTCGLGLPFLQPQSSYRSLMVEACPIYIQGLPFLQQQTSFTSPWMVEAHLHSGPPISLAALILHFTPDGRGPSTLWPPISSAAHILHFTLDGRGPPTFWASHFLIGSHHHISRVMHPTQAESPVHPHQFRLHSQPTKITPISLSD